jgi:hypothetical protein
MKQFLLKYISPVIIFLLIASVNVQAQEQLSPLGENPVIIKYLENFVPDLNRALAVDTLELPFVDDFSGTNIFPDQNLWSDKLVFINNDFPRNPITIGVATFDGLNAKGNAYNNTSASAQGSCDTLTSRPLYLLTKPAALGGGQFTIADSITLSFYYEKKGWGDAPETNDSLVVEYYNPNTNKWGRQWYSLGGVSAGNDTAFKRVEVRLLDAAYLNDGFRFRFRNYGSQTGSQDHWHIDYVRFYKAYNNITGQLDTSLIDVAFVQQGKSLLEGFTSIPWDHFKSLSVNDQQALIKDSSVVNYRVNDLQPDDVGFNNRIYNFNGDYVAGNGAPNGNIFPSRPKNINLSYKFLVDSIFPNSPEISADSNMFVIKDYFSNGSTFGGLKSNDSISYTQEFYNYYSYDDGTAEAVYDLMSTPNGKVAMRFDMIKPDTLRAIRMAFIKANLDVSTKLFTLKVWSSLSPETLIYQETNNRPVYPDSINGFTNYVLDQIIPVSGTIYIGFQQIAGDGLHLGFDRNTASNSKMFYNNGTWNQVAVAAGSFLMRPVLGDSTLFVGLKEVNSILPNVNLYPNPASNSLNIRVDHPELIQQMYLLDITGNLLRKENYSSTINLEGLVPGVYLMQFMMKNGNTVNRKFMVLGK